MKYEDIILEKREDLAVITLNRPEVLNALSRNLYREVDEAVTECESDPLVKAIIFTGSGDRAFSAGADIHENARLAEEEAAHGSDINFSSKTKDAREDSSPRRSWHIGACTKPTIGAINGLAYGGAAIMSSSFDIRVGCERSSFRFLAATYGRVNSTWSLPMQVGWPKAKELLFTGRVVEADEAYRIGLLNHLVPSDQLMDKALEIGKLIAGNDPRMVQGIKELLIQDIGGSWERMYDNEIEAQSGKLRPTPVLEAFQGFLERKGRK